MTGIATDTFATSMQPYPSQPTSHIKRDPASDKNSFHRTVTYGESHRIFTSPPQTAFPHISQFFCCLPFFLLKPSKPQKDKHDFNRFQDASSQVIFFVPKKFSFLELSTLQPSTSTPKVHAVSI